ncbi:MAG: UDP-N-acetylmuramate--L-alanine ligase [Microbacteriaceae bacterium]
MIAPDLNQPIPDELGRVHFIGIGGSGMSGIARMFVERGITVTGSDRSESATTTALRELGIDVQIGHEPTLVTAADTVVVTGALWLDNPEYVWALDHKIPVLHRSLALHWLSRAGRVIAVAGAHGKTTSTGMVVTALRGVGSSPSFVNGGVISTLGVSAASGHDSEFVLEADESDGSFLLYNVAIGLITNIDTDHLDTYGTMDEFDSAFVKFANACSEVVVISSDDPHLARLRPRISAPTLSFGEDELADVRVTDIAASAHGVTAVIRHGGQSAPLVLTVAGHHNAINATGAVAILLSMGYPLADAAASLTEFGGTGRRFELHAEHRGVRVYDDYAHHPREVRAALATARSVVGSGRVIAIHQPHLFTRTRDMAGEFAAEYETGADFTVVLDVYGAREDPIPGVTGELVSNAFADHDKVAYCPNWADAARVAAEYAQSGDIIMTLSCGDVYRIIPQVVSALDVS